MAGPHTWVSTTGDWGADASWSTGAVPLATEQVIFDGIASNVSVTTGLTTGITLARFTVLENYSGNLGTHATNPLSVNVTRFLYEGTGTAYMSGSLTYCWINSNNLVDALVWTSGGASEAHFVSGGILSTSGAGSYTGTFLYTNNVYWTVEAGATDLNHIWMLGGNVECNKGQAGSKFFTISGGEWIQTGTNILGTVIQHGGRLEINNVSGGNATVTMYSLGGITDFTKDLRDKDLQLFVVGRDATVLLHPGITASASYSDLRGAIPVLNGSL